MTVDIDRLKPHSRVEELLMVNDTIVDVDDISDEYDDLVVISVVTETTEWRLKSYRGSGFTSQPPLMVDRETGAMYETHGQYVPETVLSRYREYLELRRNEQNYSE